MCKECYMDEYRKTYNRKEVKRRADCHPDRPHAAHGLCYDCSNKAYAAKKKAEKAAKLAEM